VVGQGLPVTGSPSKPLAIAGLSLVALGAALLLVRRWTAA
jgi:LPXTG-motif cell wall-anchored protein